MKALNGIELLLPGRGECPEVVCLCFFTKSGKWCFFVCQFISIHCVCRNQTTLQIGSTHEYTVRRQICCLSRARAVNLCRFWALHGLTVVFRLVRSWLFCNRGFWLRLFVARFWLADVVSGVRCSSTWGVLLSVVLGRELLSGPLERWGAGKLFHRGEGGHLSNVNVVGRAVVKDNVNSSLSHASLKRPDSAAWQGKQQCRLQREWRGKSF